MNRHLLAGAAVLACLCLFISDSYACNPLYIDSDYKIYMGVGDTAYVDAWVDSGGPVWDWDWDWPSEFYNVSQSNNDYDATLEGTCNTTGMYTVDVDADGPNGWDDARSYVYVVDVNLYQYGGTFVGLYEDEEDELVEVGISLSLAGLSYGTVELSVTGDVNVWYDSEKEYEVSLPASWSVARSQVPSTIYVEGTSVSSEVNDVSMTISYDYFGPTLAEDTANFTVLNVQITEPTGTDFDDQFAFDMSGPTGYCNITVTGTTGISALNADLEWTLTGISDSNLTSDPDPAEGDSVTFTYRGLPNSNSQFGEKTLTLEYLDSGIKDTKTLEIFFEPEATNNPGEDDGRSTYPFPNWFYYWAKDRGFYYGGTTSTNCGEYRPGDDTLWLFASAYTETEENEDYIVDLYNHRYRTNINTGESGIANTPEQNISTDDTKILYFEDTLHNEKIYSNPNSVAITAGANGVIDSDPHGWCGHGPFPYDLHDDAIIDSAEGEVLHTGYDGILEILGGKSDYDEWKVYEYMDRQKNINNSYGQPWYISITHGDDDWLQTDPEYHGWDEIDLTGVEPVTFTRPKEWIGIDFVNVVCNHELIHQDLYDMVRTNPEGPPPYDYDHPDDDDDDCVHDIDVEGKSPFYLSPYEDDTYNMAIDFYEPNDEHGPYDNEFLCFMGQDDSSVDPSTDWSVGGKQWHKE